MEIRVMTSGDYQDVYQLWLSCQGMGLNQVDDSLEGINKFLLRNPQTCFVANVNQKIVGSILVGNDGRRAYIYHLAVHPNFRKRGIGSELLNGDLSALKQLEVIKVALVVFENNPIGNDFWQNQGITVRDDLIYRNLVLSDWGNH